MIRIKDDTVSLVGLVPQMVLALRVAESLFDRMEVDTVITSGSESSTAHSPTSLHYAAAALDLRTKHLRERFEDADRRVRVIAGKLNDALGIDFDVVLEDPGGDNEHLHIEYQPKRR